VVNIIIQALTDKSRPEEYILNKENLILSHLPTDPFPSDHAAVSAAIAMATYTRGKKNNDPLCIRISYFFWFASLTM
jgi:membrane-associated phospholipid phosphatase